MNQSLINEITATAATVAPDRVFILSDSNVGRLEAPLIEALKERLDAVAFTTPAGEENKNLASLERILSFLSESKATRKSLLICIGGGMTTDIGGFAAAIFKRGMPHINVATTLLAAVDAAVGGKTGIDFNGLKNEIGAFKLPLATLADHESFATLTLAEILSGYGEVIKTALITSAEMTERILADSPLEADDETLDCVCRFCRDAKMSVIEQDPTEKGLRKILNFGHTAGHAIESLLLEKGTPLPHGSAIAHGNLVALILSMMLEGLDKSWVSRYTRWLRVYPAARFTCADYDRIWQLATHDKKNSSPDALAYTLISAPGRPIYDRPVDRRQLFEALDLYQELCGR